MARGILAQIGVEGQETMASESKTEAVPERFEEILGRLRGIVERLEGGNLPLEDSLRAFEEGMELCRRGTVILDGAEKKVETLLAAGRAELDRLFETRLAPPPAGDPGRLLEAMRYSLLAPGKRIRPLLAIAAAEAVGAVDGDVLLACAAVELVHCYSLIHDDLPAMDDDDFRRGRPSNHKAFGEATAILAGDALLTLAFDWIAEAGERAGRPQQYLAASRALARGAGAFGMVRGQARDLGEP